MAWFDGILKAFRGFKGEAPEIIHGAEAMLARGTTAMEHEVGALTQAISAARGGVGELRGAEEAALSAQLPASRNARGVPPPRTPLIPKPDLRDAQLDVLEGISGPANFGIHPDFELTTGERMAHVRTVEIPTHPHIELHNTTVAANTPPGTAIPGPRNIKDIDQTFIHTAHQDPIPHSMVAEHPAAPASASDTVFAEGGVQKKGVWEERVTNTIAASTLKIVP